MQSAYLKAIVYILVFIMLSEIFMVSDALTWRTVGRPAFPDQGITMVQACHCLIAAHEGLAPADRHCSDRLAVP
jgi:hypothetical protein